MTRAASQPHPVQPHAVVPRPVRPRGLRLAAGALLLGGCVGPTFQRPAPPTVDRYTTQPLAAATASAPGPGGEAQKFLMERDVPRNWWTLFGSPDLDALVTEAFAANPDVKSAQAALRQAQEATAAQRGNYFPNVQASFSASRNRDATGVVQPTLQSGTPLYDLFTPQVSISYIPDLFGANRRAVESLEAQADASRYQLDATYLTLAANVVAAAIQEAGLKAQIDGTQHAIDLERQSLDVMRKQLELGAIAEADVYAQEAAMAQLEANLPPLQKQWHVTVDQLAALTGHTPADFTPKAIALEQLTLPLDLPLGVPSRLVEQRPDVRAAEAQLHSATAQVGVAIANLLPQVTLTGNLGSTASMYSDLFKPGTGFWSLGANAAQTLFAGGTLIHRKRQADAALEQAAAQYRAAVITAFQNVADALHALDADAAALDAAARSAGAAEKSLGVAHHQVELGSVGPLALYASEQLYQQAVVTLAQARANRYADTAALFQALGGGILQPR